MQIDYKETFLTGFCERKPTLQIIQKKAQIKDFDVDNLYFYLKDGYYHFQADTYPSKQTTKDLENEILDKLDILFQRKQYTKEEQTELKRLIWK